MVATAGRSSRDAAWTARALVVGWGDVRVAVGVDATDRPGGLHLLNTADTADHGRRGSRQLDGVAGEALPVADGEQVGAELVDLVEQAGLGGGGQAEDGDDGSHADGDTESGQPGPQFPGAQSHAREAGQVRQLQPFPAHGGGGGHDGSSQTGAQNDVCGRRLGRGRRGRSRRSAPAAEPVSATIWPSRISTLRGMRLAMAWSWVMTTMVEPAWWSWSIRARMDCPVAWSRLPVGSSASTMAGWPTRARAMATRWRWPPESWVGRAWGRCGQADQFQGVEGALAALLEGDAGVEEPVGHVVQHRGVLGQEELLEDEPDPGGPQVGQLVVGHGGDVQPRDPYVAAGGPVEGSHQLQQGGLARPRRADDPDQLPLADGEVHPAQGLDGRLAGIAPGHVVHIEHRHPGTADSEAVAGRDRVAVGCGWQGVGHVAGTTTCWPAASPEPVTCTSPSASSNSPSDTATRWLVPPAPTTSTA